MIKVQRFYSALALTSLLIVTVATLFFKVSFIIGSKMAFFSGVDVLSPLSGFFGGMSCAFLLFFVRYVTQPFALVTFFVRHIPGFCGAWYWSSSSVLVRVLLPAACMLAFVAHPVGAAAYGYSFFWLIPIFLFFADKQTLFYQALGSTFVTHAVGSVVWLYTVPMTPLQWWALIPVVVVERLVFALLQVGVIVLWRQLTTPLIPSARPSLAEKGVSRDGSLYNIHAMVKKQLVRVFSL